MRARLTAFFDRHPLLGSALGMAACIAVADHVRPALAAAALVVGLVGWGFGCWRRGLGWLLCGLLAGGLFVWRNDRRDEAGAALLGSGTTLAAGVLLEDGEGFHGGWTARVRLDAGPQAGAVVWWQGWGQGPVAGTWVRAQGNFQPLPTARNPGEFDHGAWLRRHGVAVVFRTTRALGEIKTGELAAWGGRLRQGFRTAVTAGLPEDSQEARVIRAVVIGETPPDAEDLVLAFRNSGTLHIFSVSGMHVAMVASIGWLVLRWLGVPRRQAVWILLVLVFGYTWITGNSPPALRSAWMAAVFMGAFVWRRRPDLLNALGVVLFCALWWDGNLLFLPGVQLSYGVVAAIAVGTPWAMHCFAWMARPELYLPAEMMSRWQRGWLRVRQRTAQSLSVSLAASAGSTPLTVFHFGLVTPISIIGTLVLSIPVFLLLVLALAAAAFHPLAPGAARIINRGNGMVANTCVNLAAALASVPGGNFNLRRNRTPVLIVHDLGRGAGATVMADGTDSAVLLDCGDPRAFKSRLAPALRRLGITPDAVVLSHPDGAHLGGGAQVWTAFPIRQALLPVTRALSPAYRAWVTDAPKAGIRTMQTTSIRSLPMPDDARLEVLHAPDPHDPVTLADDRVAVYRLHWRGWKILLTSDAGARTEQIMLDSGADLAADVIVTGRHTGDLSLGDAFISRVRPQAIIAGNAVFPPEERRNAGQIAYWQSLGIHVLDQLRTGGVTVTVDDEGALVLTGFADHSTIRLQHR